MATGHVDQLRVRRERTAIVRFRQSKPVMLALSHGIIAAGRSVLDYGCGRGEDVAHLKSSGIETIGWDPHFQADTPITSADVVNLGYVLNVIENPIERDDTLRRAFQLAKRALVVAVRVAHALGIGTEFADGLLASRGPFQKLYSQSHVRQAHDR